jgi:hypothetical protein
MLCNLRLFTGLRCGIVAPRPAPPDGSMRSPGAATLKEFDAEGYVREVGPLAAGEHV